MANKSYLDHDGLSYLWGKIKALLAGKAESGHSHSYNDLTDKPTIPAAYTHPTSHPASMITGLATVATSGSYNDLSNKPTIPSYSAATQSAAGLMSADDKKKVDGLDPITTAGDGAAYTASVPHITALTAGVSFVMVPHTVSTSTTATLNVNGLGAKQIRRRLTNMATSLEAGYSASWLASGKPFRVKYDGTYWVVEDMPKPAAADLYGTMGVTKGGTGKTSVTAGNFLVGNGTSAMTEKTPAEVKTALGLSTETWTFTLEDGSTVTKAVYVG